MAQPRFIAVFKPTRSIRRNVINDTIDHVVHIAYDDTGQRWGFVERVTMGPNFSAPRWKPDAVVARGWVKLPTKILDEEWPEDV